jgi:hypothetical protein
VALWNLSVSIGIKEEGNSEPQYIHLVTRSVGKDRDLGGIPTMESPLADNSSESDEGYEGEGKMREIIIRKIMLSDVNNDGEKATNSGGEGLESNYDNRKGNNMK